MNYGNVKSATAGTVLLTGTGLTLGEQVAVILAAVIVVAACAVMLRKFWRRGKGLSE